MTSYKALHFWVYEVETVNSDCDVEYNRHEKPVGEVTVLHPDDGDNVYIVEDNAVLFAAVDTWIETGKRLTSVEMLPGKRFGYSLFDADENMLFQLIEISEKEDATNGE